MLKEFYSAIPFRSTFVHFKTKKRGEEKVHQEYATLRTVRANPQAMPIPRLFRATF